MRDSMVNKGTGDVTPLIFRRWYVPWRGSEELRAILKVMWGVVHLYLCASRCSWAS